MKSIFNKEAYNEILSRLDKLDENKKAKWGKMNVIQMLEHCQKPIELALGEREIKKPNFFMGLLLKSIKSTLYNDKPWKENLPTAKEFIITNTASFPSVKQDLKLKIDRMHNSEDLLKPSRVHPVFGRFTAEQWGKSAYKHLDHHLKQFGV